MGNFNRDRDSRGGRRGFGGGMSYGGGGRGGFSRGDSGPRQMFSAICSDCGKNCQVPFRPTGEKPVYCSECFEKMGGKSERRSFDRPRREDGGRDDSLRIQLEALSVKLDKIISLLQPRPEVKVEEVPVEKAEAKPAKIKKPAKKKSSEKAE